MNETSSQFRLAYGNPDDKPRSLKDTIIYSVQWIFMNVLSSSMGLCNSWIGIRDFPGDVLGQLYGQGYLMIGVSTLAQALFDHRLSMVSGSHIILHP